MRILVETDVEMIARDGIALRADVYRADDDERRPVLLMRTPYSKGNLSALFHLDPRRAVARGYVVVIQDVRGRFSSDGTWLPWAHEADDGEDAVAWVAGLPSSDGRVGMWGASYFGNTQWQAARTSPAALRALIPGTTWSTPFDGLFLRGGAPEHGLAMAWSLQTGFGELIRRGDHEGAAAAAALYDDLPRGAYSAQPHGRVPLLDELGVPDLGLARLAADPATASESDVLATIDQISVPALHLGGWYDLFLQGTLDTFERQRARGLPARLVVGPWSHDSPRSSVGGDRDFGLAASGETLFLTTNITELELDFFDQVFGGVDPDPQPEVLIFVMGIDRWRAEHEWPLARAVPTRYLLHADGSLGADGAEAGTRTFRHDPATPVPTVGGSTVMHAAYPPGAWDQRAIEERRDVLVFDSGPLADDLEVTGRIVAHLDVRAASPSSDWVVRICDVFPDGRSITLADGIARVPGAGEHEVDIDLWSTSVVFLRGHRIRVHVTGSNFPRWGLAPDDRAGDRDVLCGPGRSSILLPVVPS